MRAWIWMTGGLLVWAAHFTGVYAIASLADVVARADDFGWRMLAVAFTGVCALACVGLFVWALAVRRRTSGPESFKHDMALLSALVGGIAIVWQGAPALIGH